MRGHRESGRVAGLFSELCSRNAGIIACMSDLRDKVSAWLSQQGFPLEFSTSATLAKHGFRVEQGVYVRDPKVDILREVDIVARIDNTADEFAYSVSLVVECKWSRDRPWVIFTSKSAVPTIQESIAYTLGSPFGEAVMWALATERTIQAAHRAMLPPRFGFAGRQALTQKQDKELFYPTIQSVVGASVAVKERASSAPNEEAGVGLSVDLVFPVIVIDAELFEAFLDKEVLRVEPLEQGRVRWRGFDDPARPVTVDVVTVAGLDGFAQRMANCADVLEYYIRDTAPIIRSVIRSKRMSDLSARLSKMADIVLPGLLKGFLS